MKPSDLDCLESIRRARSAEEARRALVRAMVMAPDRPLEQVRVLRRTLARRLEQLARLEGAPPSPEPLAFAATDAGDPPTDMARWRDVWLRHDPNPQVTTRTLEGERDAPAEADIETEAAWRAAWLRPDADTQALRRWVHAHWQRDPHGAELLSRLLAARDEWLALEAAGELPDAIRRAIRTWVRTGDTEAAGQALQQLEPQDAEALQRLLQEAPLLLGADERLFRPLVDPDYARRLARSSVSPRFTARRAGGTVAVVFLSLWAARGCVRLVRNLTERSDGDRSPPPVTRPTGRDEEQEERFRRELEEMLRTLPDGTEVGAPRPPTSRDEPGAGGR